MSAFGLKITNPHYSNMAMPAADASVRDWPKWVYPDGPKSGVIVQNAEEEAAVLANPKAPAPVIIEPVVVAAPAPVAILTGSNDEKTLLLALAKEKNIKVDARWNITRLRSHMEKNAP